MHTKKKTEKTKKTPPVLAEAPLDQSSAARAVRKAKAAELLAADPPATSLEGRKKRAAAL